MTALIGLSFIGCKASGRGTMNSDPLAGYNVVWTTPSEDHNGSMPIGNGDIGMNVWVEQDGDLMMLLGKTDAWSENCRLLKLGRVRVRLAPNPFVAGVPFKQTLCLRKGEIAISAGEGAKAVCVRIWVDANHPVVRIEIDSPSPLAMQARLDVWRTGKRELGKVEVGSAYGLHSGPSPVIVYPDTVLDGQKERIVWYHRNENSIWQANLKHQGMADFIPKSVDPLLNRTFGGQISGAGLVNSNSTTLESKTPQEHFVLSIHALCMQTQTINSPLKKWP